jgi:hypothetical protein
MANQGLPGTQYDKLHPTRTTTVNGYYLRYDDCAKEKEVTLATGSVDSRQHRLERLIISGPTLNDQALQHHDSFVMSMLLRWVLVFFERRHAWTHSNSEGDPTIK